MPHCTVLHRCTDETGCCRSERQTCAPKRTKNVDLYFYVSMSVSRKKYISQFFVSVRGCQYVTRSACACTAIVIQRCVLKHKYMPMWMFGCVCMSIVAGELCSQADWQSSNRAAKIMRSLARLLINCQCVRLARVKLFQLHVVFAATENVCYIATDMYIHISYI